MWTWESSKLKALKPVNITARPSGHKTQKFCDAKDQPWQWGSANVWCFLLFSHGYLAVFRIGNNCGSFHRRASTKNSTVQSLQEDATALQYHIGWQAPVKFAWRNANAKQCVDYIVFYQINVFINLYIYKIGRWHYKEKWQHQPANQGVMNSSATLPQGKQQSCACDAPLPAHSQQQCPGWHVLFRSVRGLSSTLPNIFRIKCDFS